MKPNQNAKDLVAYVFDKSTGSVSLKNVLVSNRYIAGMSFVTDSFVAGFGKIISAMVYISDATGGAAKLSVVNGTDCYDSTESALSIEIGELGSSFPRGTTRIVDISHAFSQGTGYPCQALNTGKSIRLQVPAPIFGNSEKTEAFVSLVGTLLPRLCPSILNGKPMSKEIQGFLRKFYDKEWDELDKLLSNVINFTEIRKHEIKKTIDGFFGADPKIKALEAEIQKLTATIKELYTSISETICQKDEKTAMLTGLLAGDGMDEAENELIDFLSQSRSIEILGRSLGCIYFDVQTFLRGWRQSDYNRLIRDVRSGRGIYYDPDYAGRHFSYEEKKALYKAIFEDKKYKLGIHAIFYITDDGNVFPTYANEYLNGRHYYKNCVPNPHLMYNSCVGNYGLDFADAAERKDYLAAFNVAVASTSCVNLAEGVSAKYMVRHLMDSDVDKPILFNDGEWFTPNEVVRTIFEKAKVEPVNEEYDNQFLF